MWPFIFIASLYILIPSALSQESCRTPLGTSGTCINLKKCDNLMTALRNSPQDEKLRNYLRNSLCGYEGTEPQVCCHLSDLSNEYTGTMEPLTPPECGETNFTIRRIVGGVRAKLGDWPWMAVLGYGNLQKPRWLCGGCLISKRHVLTAAHCIMPSLHSVRIGDLDLDDDNDGAKPFQDYIQSITSHPKYNSRTGENDIAILKTTNAVPFTSLRHPICLPVDAKNRDRDITYLFPIVAGWGTTSFRGSASRQLFYTQIPVRTEQECNQAYQNVTGKVIDNRVVCAGFAQGGKDSCQGDSGGPLMLPIVGKQNIYSVIGVVSYGYKCAEPGYPGVYTKVTSFLDFILSNMK